MMGSVRVSICMNCDDGVSDDKNNKSGQRMSHVVLI